MAYRTSQFPTAKSIAETVTPTGICACGCGQPTQPSKYDDPRNGYRKGVPRPYVRGHGRIGKRTDDIVRFMRFVQRGKPDECWEWTGGRRADGYGVFRPNGGNVTQAHRFAYELANGSIPEGVQIGHTCGNRGCVNPSHLWSKSSVLPDSRPNYTEAIRHLRPHTAKLEEAQVTEIRRRFAAGGVSKRTLSKEYSISLWNIYKIVRRESWKWVK